MLKNTGNYIPLTRSLAFSRMTENRLNYLHKERGHSFRGIVESRYAVNHTDGIDQSRDGLNHANLQKTVSEQFKY